MQPGDGDTGKGEKLSQRKTKEKGAINQMTLEEQARLSCYREIAVLNESHHVILVQHTQTMRVYVKKCLSVFHAGVYRYLQMHPVPHTPCIYEALEDGEKLIVIEEYISGSSLREILDEKGRFPQEEAIGIASGICVALHGLHTATPPIIHRDIKPSNIMITPAGEIVLLDMNAAKPFSEGKQADTQLIGTHGYAAPEQYGFGASDIQADIYAVGVVLNEMLTGMKPSEKMADGKTGQIVARCTMMDARERYASAEELRAVLAGDSLAAYRGAQKRRRFLPPGFRSGDAFWGLLAAVGYLVLISLTLSFNLEDASFARQWMNRMSFFVSVMSVVLFTGNYLDVWEFAHLNQIRNKWLKALAVIVADAFIFAFLLVLFGVLEQRLFG